MRNYTTQMDAARKNIITPEMEKVAAQRTYDDQKKSEHSLQKERLLSVPTKIINV